MSTRPKKKAPAREGDTGAAECVDQLSEPIDSQGTQRPTREQAQSPRGRVGGEKIAFDSPDERVWDAEPDAWQSIGAALDGILAKLTEGCRDA